MPYLEALSPAIVRRPAPARRHGPRHRARPAGVPVRRAAVQPRCQAARADAHRDQGAAPAPEDHHRLRHPRPGRGDDHGRQDRRHAGRPHRAGRRAARTVRPARQPVRRRLHRLAGHEHAARARCGSATAAGRRGRGRALPFAGARQVAEGQEVDLRHAARAYRACRRTALPRASSVVEPTGSETLVFLRFGDSEHRGAVSRAARFQAGRHDDAAGRVRTSCICSTPAPATGCNIEKRDWRRCRDHRTDRRKHAQGDQPAAQRRRAACAARHGPRRRSDHRRHQFSGRFDRAADAARQAAAGSTT